MCDNAKCRGRSHTHAHASAWHPPRVLVHKRFIKSMRPHHLRRAAAAATRRQLSTFYDSQSGRHVQVPTGVQCHVGLDSVAIDRVSSAMKHLVKDGQLLKGLASVSQRAWISNAADLDVLDDAGRTDVAINVSELAAGVEAVKAARERGLRARAILAPTLCEDKYAVQLGTAELGDAGAEAIMLSLSAASATTDDVREMTEMACEIDLEDVPMRSRLGLCLTKPGAESLELAKFAYSELELLHFYTCLAGKRGPRPSELLQALGVGNSDARYGVMYLAEHVPDAA